MDRKRSAMCPVPPMGWNSWNTFTENINEELILSTADVMVNSGLRDAGYSYLVIDDCWSLKERGSCGELIADPEKFPHGMKYVADYIHGKGLKFGMYSCCGTRTCAGYPGSFEHEFRDAAQFAAWGVDYLKYDNCYKPKTVSSELLFHRMGLALANCGRDIVFSACQWGTENVHQWIRSSGAHLFRSTGDIQNCWSSIIDIAQSQMDLQGCGAAYCHNDMDMLVVGMYDAGGNEYISAGGCTDAEYQTHFALWALMGSPLMIGCDIRRMSDSAAGILMNKEVIAINQDTECRAAYRIMAGPQPDNFVLVKHLTDGSLALGYFNIGDADAHVSLEFWDLGLGAASGYGLEFRDIIAHEDLGLKREYWSPVIEPHGCRVYRCRPVKLND